MSAFPLSLRIPNTCCLISKPSWISCEQKYSQAQSITFIFIGQAWASPTLAWLHCTHIYFMCACLFLPTTYCKFQISRFKYFNVHADYTLVNRREQVWRATARLQRPGEREQEQPVECVGSTQGNLYFLINLCYEFTIAWQVSQAAGDTKNVQWQGLLWVSAWYGCSYTAQVHCSLSVNLCPVIVYRLAGRIAALSNSPLAQACPRMMQHLLVISTYTICMKNQRIELISFLLNPWLEKSL